MPNIDAARVNRRDFMKLSGVGLSGLLLHPAGKALASPPDTDLAILYDASKCLGCRACERACAAHNGLANTEDPNQELLASAWNVIVTREGAKKEDLPFFNYQCMHCTDAACALACPSDALSINEKGFVAFDQTQCIGCGYCTEFCPFGIPQLGSVNLITGEAVSSKCTFCQDKIAAGTGGPSCAEACPTGALIWGERGALLNQARARVHQLQAEGQSGARLYGEHEAGGLHRLSILLDEPQAYGLPDKPEGSFLLARFYRKILQPAGFAIFGVALVGVTAAYGLARRNIRMEEVE